MASYIREKLTGAQPADGDNGEADKYFIQVAAATSYDDSKAKQVTINGPPCSLDKNCKVSVRIKEYQGIPLGSPATSAYFEDPTRSKDTYSIAVSWIPEEDIDADDLVWGIELINPIGDRIPKRFITTAFEIVKGFVDPSLQCDPYADRPWLNGPVLCSSAITFSIGSSLTVPSVLQEGGLPDDAAIRSKHNIPDSEAARRKHFSSEEHRKSFKFEKGRCYAFDFHNGYIDWKNYALKLPGFSFGVLKYVSDRTHTTRFVLKKRSTGQVCVATTFRLLYGEELEKAKREGGKAGKVDGAAEGETPAEGGEKKQSGNSLGNSNAETATSHQDQQPKQEQHDDAETGDTAQQHQEQRQYGAADSTLSKDLPGSRSGTTYEQSATSAAQHHIDEASDQEDAHKDSIEQSLVATASSDGRDGRV